MTMMQDTESMVRYLNKYDGIRANRKVLQADGVTSIMDINAKLFLRFLPFAEHLKCRAVCHNWKSASNEMGMAPADAGDAWTLEEDVRWSQEIVDTQMIRENEIWNPEFVASLKNMFVLLHSFVCVLLILCVPG